MIALATATTVGAGLFLSAAPAASAAPATVTACFDHTVAINNVDPNGHWPGYSEATTTSFCNDINVKMNTTTSVRTCFRPSSGNIFCNDWRTVYAKVWGLAATDVRDGTHFWLEFLTDSVTGIAAF
jgi:hypothetical protein